MTSPARIEDLSKAMGDINEVVAAIAIASTLDQDQALRRKLRRHADCPDDQPLNLELPVGSAGLQLRPDGSIHPVRAAEIQPATNFDHLVAQSVELQSMIERARPRITETVSAAILPFLFPGVLPSRDEYLRLDRWAPLIERPAYRFCARAFEELASWRASALAEAVEDMSGKETVLEKYYALIHTVAHLTLLCSGSGATPWLSDMAKSFTWTNWTPTFPLVRERTSGSPPPRHARQSLLAPKLSIAMSMLSFEQPTSLSFSTLFSDSPPLPSQMGMSATALPVASPPKRR
jgi:hypothetical protein